MSVARDQPAGHPIAAVLSEVEQLLDGVRETPTWSLRDPELGELVRRAHAVSARVSELSLRLTADIGARGVATGAGATSTQAWLRSTLALRPETAKAQAVAAEALATGFGPTRAAMAAGRISLEHVEVIIRAVQNLPTDPELQRRAEQHLIEQAQTFDPRELAKLSRTLLAVVDPDAADAALGQQLARAEAQAQRRRNLSAHRDGWGNVYLRGRFDTQGWATVEAVLDPLSAPLPTGPDGPDPRTHGQRLADALVAMAQLAAGTGGVPREGGEPPTVLVQIDLDRLQRQVGYGTLVESAEPLSVAAVRALSCDSRISRVLTRGGSRILDLGRTQRFFVGAARTALVLRDKGCAFPTCDRPPAWCRGHHIKHWVDGGETNPDNGVLLCQHHHQVIDRGDWTVQIAADNLPDFTPPEWVDPQRRPRRNTIHRR